MQTDKAPFEIAQDGKAFFAPPVVVSIPDDEAGEEEKEVHGEVAVVHDLGNGAFGVALEDVVEYDDEGGHASQAIERQVMGFGVFKLHLWDFLKD